MHQGPVSFGSGLVYRHLSHKIQSVFLKNDGIVSKTLKIDLSVRLKWIRSVWVRTRPMSHPHQIPKSPKARIHTPSSSPTRLAGAPHGDFGRPPRRPLRAPRGRSPPLPQAARARSRVLPPVHQRRRWRRARALVRGARRAGALPGPPLRRLRRRRRCFYRASCRTRARPVWRPPPPPSAAGTARTDLWELLACLSKKTMDLQRILIRVCFR
jgi:hypothetical protein